MSDDEETRSQSDRRGNNNDNDDTMNTDDTTTTKQQQFGVTADNGENVVCVTGLPWECDAAQLRTWFAAGGAIIKGAAPPAPAPEGRSLIEDGDNEIDDEEQEAADAAIAAAAAAAAAAAPKDDNSSVFFCLNHQARKTGR
jgi:hypothetical protein